MRDFAALYAELDASTSTARKVAAMAGHFSRAPAEDAAWAAYFLAGGKPRQAVPAKLLREAARREAAIPEWLFEECYQAVGDLAETIARLLGPPQESDEAGLAAWMRDRVLPLRGLPPEQALEALAASWRRLDGERRFVFNKLITGGLRVGVSRGLLVRALAQASGVDARTIAQRIVGYTDARALPDASRYLALVAPEGDDGDPAADGERAARPYPFFLAHPLQQAPETLGEPGAWLAEWKWDGIRAQLVRRAGSAWLWSRGEELVSDRFPEIVDAAAALPDGTVIDAELVCWDAACGRPMPFPALQARIGRTKLTPKLLRDAPAVLLAFDLLEEGGRDLRDEPLAGRRRRLERLLGQGAAARTEEHAAAGDGIGAPGLARIRLSELLPQTGWESLRQARGSSRERGVEGLMLKRADSRYGIGRTKSEAAGDWWKWKVDPMSVDAVLVYAQRGHGRRASLYTDYTFAVWDAPPGVPERRLLPFAKAYSGLSDEEIRRVDAVIRRTTIEKFGPVRSVTPTLVFEIGFEGIARSGRHKAGIAVRFPRILRWRADKAVDEADSLEALHALLG